MSIAGTLNTVQEETSEVVAAPEGNMADMKGAMESRISEAELNYDNCSHGRRTLLASRMSYTGIQEELHHIKTALEESTRSQELSATTVSEPALPTMTCRPKPSDGSEYLESKLLSVTAPVFNPSAGSTTLVVAQPMEANHTQFSLLAELNGWIGQPKAGNLTISLRGPALTMLKNLPEEQCRDYAVLSAALQSRFGNACQAELNRAAQPRGRSIGGRCYLSLQRISNG